MPNYRLRHETQVPYPQATASLTTLMALSARLDSPLRANWLRLLPLHGEHSGTRHHHHADAVHRSVIPQPPLDAALLCSEEANSGRRGYCSSWWDSGDAHEGVVGVR